MRYFNIKTTSPKLLWEDYPKSDRKYTSGPGYVQCPKCKGHGGWNLELNCYPLHGREDTPENRHRYAHFKASCDNCNGHGGVLAGSDDELCEHELVKVSSPSMFMHEYRCLHCDTSKVYDSSG